MQNIKCILCNLDEADYFLEEEGYRAVKCRSCGLVYVNPRPGFDELRIKYNKGYLIDEDEEIAAIDEKSLKAKLDLRLIKKFKKAGRLLEIGCAEGTFLFEASKLGYEPYGIELNKKFVEYAKNTYRLSNVFQCDILESSFSKRNFDIIYMRNVLCHLYDPIRELNKIKEILKEDGIFICITSNLADLSLNRIKKYYNFCTPHLSQHLFHYSKSNLYSLFGKASFHIKEIYKFSLYLDECNGLLFRIINIILSKDLSIKVLATVRILFGRLCFKKRRMLSLMIFASKV